MSTNHVSISGNIVRRPAMRKTASGTAVASFTVAVDERRRDAETGEWASHASFIDCALFGKRAEAVKGFIKPGAKVAIDGKLRQSTWEQDGSRRSKLEVIVDDIEIMSSGKAASE